jgi:hypothetical protein
MMKIKCNVCACEFIPEKDEHYISRDKIETGLTKIVNSPEENLYDTFDCPQCGCQMVMQERKRVLCMSEKVKEEIEENDHE